MHKAHNYSNSISVYSIKGYMPQLMIVMSFFMLLLISSSSFARENNPGSNLTCPSNSTKGFLSNNSYSNLITSFNNGSYQNVISQTTATGSTNANIPLKIKMSIADFNVSKRTTVATLTSSNYSAIRITGGAANSSVRNEITLEFQNSENNDPLFLNKVALSAFDIDKSSTRTSYWDDNVKFVGITQSGTTINGSFQTIANSSVINTSGEGLRLDADANCGSTLESQCQGSVVFSDPVKSVKMIYTNTDNDTTNSITSRLFDFRLDSYCYQPASYEITKDDGTDSIGVSNITDYLITVTNNGNTPLTNIALKDPSVTGLIKQNNITCEATDSTNTCTTAPTKTQLESTNGFTISTLAVGKTYSIRVPTKVTAAEGATVTNTASIKVAELAEKQASDSDTVTPIFSGGSPVAPAICPSGHKMFYIGATPPSYTPKETLPIAWTTGSFDKEYSFGNIKFNLSFTDRLNLRPSYPTGTNFTDATTNAINMYHSSMRTDTDHKLTATINKPVSKYGFVVQDLDANQSGQYIESITLASPSGVFSRIENKPFQLSNANQTISGTAWDNCNTASPCNFNIDWGYKPALTPFAITHGNPSNGSTTTSNGNYVVGYSDFYFCLAPPKLIVKKALIGNRVNDTNAKRDQFEIKVTGDALAANTFTTSGSAAAISNSTSDLLSLAEATTYTITETIINGSANDYDATYVCNNATTGSTFTTTNGTATLNAATIPTRSFTLSNLNYGDEVTCTLTNTPASYRFSGFVFNDNGGIVASSTTKQDISSTFTANGQYFNGIFDRSNELGLADSSLSVRLTDCSSTDIVTSSPNPQTLSSNPLGQYSFIVAPSSLINKSKVCLVESEPDPWEYSVDTTTNTHEVTLVNGKLDYKTEISANGDVIRNMDFGEVKANNAALVLKKSQYVHSCFDSINYNTISANPQPDTPISGFSANPANDTIPGQCIAYRIEAFNRGHVDLQRIQITDKLQTTPIESVFNQPRPVGVPNTVYTTSRPAPNYGQNGTIISNEFNLVKVPTGSTTPTTATLFFNTKYGKTTNN